METEIRKLLVEWNPIEVPESIAKLEYSNYVSEILNLEADRKLIYDYLIDLAIHRMGLDFPESSNKDVEIIADKIYLVLKE